MAKNEAAKNEVDLNGLNIPQHVAIILDGNGRWAKKRHMPRNYGHLQGANNIEQICRDADSIGIKYLTIYAFSTENWNRSKDEVDALMKILENYLKSCIEKANSNNMRVRVIGERSRLHERMVKRIEELEEVSKNNTGLNFTVALNYGSRDEITRAVKKIAKDVEAGKLQSENINEALIGS